MNSKYFPNMSIVDWFKIPSKSSKGSIVWNALVESFKMVGVWTVWKVGNGRSIRLGEDPRLGSRQNYIILGLLLQKLRVLNIFNLKKQEREIHRPEEDQDGEVKSPWGSLGS
jgi:hypothetical protein